MMKLSVGLPIVPFHSLPIKEWHDGKEKKPRIPEKEYLPKKISEEEDDDDDYGIDCYYNY